ncbi:UDP-N-acetylmuramoyl-L-alanine--D-glutamate ligase [Dietzia sp.]|uniref:UDP-N-acetylmuramoyl-L-alanine--D-glutamate ligase n=1 Tax=Dietzia sp. TaxID=1871616 RepID=UPI002FDB5C66
MGINRAADISGARVLVAGAGVSGPGAVRLVLRLGGRAVVADGRPAALDSLLEAVAGAEGLSAAEASDVVGTASVDEALGLLENAGAGEGDGDSSGSPAEQSFDLVVTSPGWRPDSPLLRAAADAGIPVWGDVELAWRADSEGHFGAPRTWLAVTGTNGKTTTTGMLADMLVYGGLAAAACGNIGVPVPDVLLASPRIDVLAAELSSFQLHWAPSCRPRAGVVLNIAEDHLDWHGSMEAYVAAKAQVLDGDVAVVGADDPVAAGLLAGAAAPTKVSVTLGEPAAGQLGIDRGRLVDRAFADGVGDAFYDATVVRPAGPAGQTDALAAAALARAVGVGTAPIATALDDFEVAAHRAAEVARISGVIYVDDSKATNPHAARTSLLAGGMRVWIAGGLLKGASVDELVAEVAPTLRGVVLFGRDRAEIAEAMRRHAPQVPVVELPPGDDSDDKSTGETPDPQPIMDEAVRLATEMAQAGDTVLLAPAAASMDMFVNYSHRGDSFVEAVAALRGGGADDNSSSTEGGEGR